MTPEQRERLEAMVKPDQATWDLSDNDVKAIRAALEEIDRLKAVEAAANSDDGCMGDGYRLARECSELKFALATVEKERDALKADALEIARDAEESELARLDAESELAKVRAELDNANQLHLGSIDLTMAAQAESASLRGQLREARKALRQAEWREDKHGDCRCPWCGALYVCGRDSVDETEHAGTCPLAKPEDTPRETDEEKWVRAAEESMTEVAEAFGHPLSPAQLAFKQRIAAPSAPRDTLEVENVPTPENFERELSSLLNRYSMENRSNTPDFIIAAFLADCLAAFNVRVTQRSDWYGRHDRPGQGRVFTLAEIEAAVRSANESPDETDLNGWQDIFWAALAPSRKGGEG